MSASTGGMLCLSRQLQVVNEGERLEPQELRMQSGEQRAEGGEWKLDSGDCGGPGGVVRSSVCRVQVLLGWTLRADGNTQ